MPVLEHNPMARVTLGVFYQFDIPMSPRVAAENFTVTKEQAKEIFRELAAHGYLEEVEDGVYVITEKGKEVARSKVTFRSAARMRAT